MSAASSDSFVASFGLSSRLSGLSLFLGGSCFLPGSRFCDVWPTGVFLGVGACPDSSAELESSCNSSVLPESVLLFGGSGFLVGSGVCDAGFLGVLLARGA